MMQSRPFCIRVMGKLAHLHNSLKKKKIFHTPFVLFLIINKSSIIICNNQLLISSNNFFFFCLDSFQLLPFKLIHFIQVIRSLHPQCQRYVHPGVDSPYIGDQGASSWPCVHVDSAASWIPLQTLVLSSFADHWAMKRHRKRQETIRILTVLGITIMLLLLFQFYKYS